MTDLDSAMALHLLRQMLQDRAEHGEVGPLERYLSAYPSHRMLVRAVYEEVRCGGAQQTEERGDS